MAREKTTIIPSTEARQLYNLMVARAGADLHLDLHATLELSCERRQQGHHDIAEIHELTREGWISEAESGGWLLDCA